MAEVLAIMGLLASLADVVQKLVEAVDKGTKARASLEEHYRDLKICVVKLGKWEARWGGRDAVLLWGEEGEKNIAEQRETVSQLQKDIMDFLTSDPLKDRFSRHPGAWKVWLVDHVTHKTQKGRYALVELDPPQDLPISLYKRVAMAIYQDDHLHDRLRKLSIAVDNLRELAMDYHDKMSGAEREKTEQLDRIEGTRIAVDHIERAMQELHRDLGPPRHSFALLLPWPSPSPTKDLAGDAAIQLEFLYLPGGFEDGGAARHLSIEYPSKPGISGKLTYYIADSMKSVRGRDQDVQLSVDLKTELKRLAEHNTLDRNALNRMTLERRLEIALCVTTWAVMGWHLHWTKDLCSCRIRQATFRNNPRTPVFYHDSAKPSHQKGHCSKAPASQRPYLHLGVLLAEIALIRPVCLTSSHDDPENAFCIWDYKIRESLVERNEQLQEQKCRNVSESVLASEAGFHMRSNAYEKIIQYCLAFKQDVDAQQHNPGISMMMHVQHIVEPLESQYNAIREDNGRKLDAFGHMAGAIRNALDFFA